MIDITKLSDKDRESLEGDLNKLEQCEAILRAYCHHAECKNHVGCPQDHAGCAPRLNLATSAIWIAADITGNFVLRGGRKEARDIFIHTVSKFREMFKLHTKEYYEEVAMLNRVMELMVRMRSKIEYIEEGNELNKSRTGAQSGQTRSEDEDS